MTDILHAEEVLWQKIKNIIFDETYKEDPLFKRHRVEIESGVVHVLYNNIGNSSDSGALFSTNKLHSSPNFYARFSYYFNLDKKNSFRFMIAPLSLSGVGNLDNNFNYGNQDFTEGQASYLYKFNSYRVTYRRTVFESDKFILRVGLTLKIRDALIKLSQNNHSYQESNVGVVPLMHINAEYKILPQWTLVYESDLAAAPQGRAIDIAFSSRYNVNDYLDFSAGYRFLEGGASNQAVYNMAFINYYFLAIGVRF